MNFLALATGFLQVAKLILEARRTANIEEGIRAKAAREALDETLELIRHARRIDQDTANLPDDARRRVQRALIRETAVSGALRRGQADRD